MIHQHLWNLLVIIPTTIVDVRSLCVHTGVDSIYLVFKSHQHQPTGKGIKSNSVEYGF
jgi:hypothetical protein